MIIELIPCLQDNYSYLIIDKNNNACVVDPGEAQPVIDLVEKKNVNLKYILNTHHHYDHIDGNEELKKRYNSIVVGYSSDVKRIPGINVLVEDNQVWKADSFEAKIIHVPGHTSGHICYHFFNEKLLFSGDTLFSLGCGKLFEGTYQEMFESLNKLKSLPEDTKIYCGHEYTLQNSKFCIKHDPTNSNLQIKILEITEKLEKDLPTIPSTIKDEIECNIFLRAKNLESFSKLRDLKDNF
jgi:hydroxyacylglutathione hydrolase